MYFPSISFSLPQINAGLEGHADSRSVLAAFPNNTGHKKAPGYPVLRECDCTSFVCFGVKFSVLLTFLSVRTVC
jgi:hypothetical protein